MKFRWPWSKNELAKPESMTTGFSYEVNGVFEIRSTVDGVETKVFEHVFRSVKGHPDSWKFDGDGIAHCVVEDEGGVLLSIYMKR